MKNKYLIIISIIVFVNENIFSQNEVEYVRPSGVLKDFDTKKYGIIDKNGDTIVLSFMIYYQTAFQKNDS
ncbi:MAG: hypothetical protein IPN79_17535 [Saprospiraceae bacterium]|nr:hypothetical protein [Saprospiraceae bacterium]